MTQVTLQTHHHRSIKHFIPGLALTAVITGAAVWAGSVPAIAGAGMSAVATEGATPKSRSAGVSSPKLRCSSFSLTAANERSRRCVLVRGLGVVVMRH